MNQSIHRIISLTFLLITSTCMFSQMRFSVGPSFGIFDKEGFDPYSGSGETKIHTGFQGKIIFPYKNSLLIQSGFSTYPSANITSFDFDTRWQLPGSSINIDPLFGSSFLFIPDSFVGFGYAIHAGVFTTLSIQEAVNIFIEPKLSYSTLGFGIFVSSGVLF